MTRTALHRWNSFFKVQIGLLETKPVVTGNEICKSIPVSLGGRLAAHAAARLAQAEAKRRREALAAALAEHASLRDRLAESEKRGDDAEQRCARAVARAAAFPPRRAMHTQQSPRTPVTTTPTPLGQQHARENESSPSDAAAAQQQQQHARELRLSEKRQRERVAVASKRCSEAEACVAAERARADEAQRQRAEARTASARKEVSLRLARASVPTVSIEDILRESGSRLSVRDTLEWRACVDLSTSTLKLSIVTESGDLKRIVVTFLKRNSLLCVSGPGARQTGQGRRRLPSLPTRRRSASRDRALFWGVFLLSKARAFLRKHAFFFFFPRLFFFET